MTTHRCDVSTEAFLRHLVLKWDATSFLSSCEEEHFLHESKQKSVDQIPKTSSAILTRQREAVVPVETQAPHRDGLPSATATFSQGKTGSSRYLAFCLFHRSHNPDYIWNALIWSGAIAHTCNPSTWEAEARGLLRVQGHLGLQGKTLSQKYIPQKK